jgi:hypothetical protein
MFLLGSGCDLEVEADWGIVIKSGGIEEQRNSLYP